VIRRKGLLLGDGTSGERFTPKGPEKEKKKTRRRKKKKKALPARKKGMTGHGKLAWKLKKGGDVGER